MKIKAPSSSKNYLQVYIASFRIKFKDNHKKKKKIKIMKKNADQIFFKQVMINRQQMNKSS